MIKICDFCDLPINEGERYYTGDNQFGKVYFCEDCYLVLEEVY